MSDTATAQPAPAPVATNPALVEFPRDQWGMTSDLRKAGLRAAASVRGNPEKQALLMATLRVIAAHAQARMPGDVELLKARLAQIDARKSSAPRVSTPGVPEPEAAVEPAPETTSEPEADAAA